MRYLFILTACLFPLALTAAKPPTRDRYAEFSARSPAGGTFKLDDEVYNQLTKAPRDYSVAILLTALEARLGCTLCVEFQPEWEILAKSWRKGDKKGKGRLLFGTLDFKNGKQTFQSLMLQTAPVLLLFQPTTGPNAKADPQPIRHDFSQGPHSAENINAWIQRHLPEGPKPPVSRPVNYVKIVSTVTAILGAISLLTVAAPYIIPILQNRNIWAGISIIAVLLFTSGHMFNHIRKVPYAASDGKGGISYFAGGFQNQLGMETQIIAAMYGILSFAAISLALKAPRIADPKTQQFTVLLWSAVMLVMYSMLMNVFRMKNGSYPFWLPPF